MVRDNWVHRRPRGGQRGTDSFVATLQVGAGSECAHVVNCLELGQVVAQSWLERIVYRKHARPEGVAADRRDLYRLEDRGEGWLAPVGHVGVPLSSVGLLISFPDQYDDVFAVRVRGVGVVPDAQ